MPRKPKKPTRRGNKEGSIYQRKNGDWCGQVLIGYKSDGKPNRKTFYGKTREEVAEKVTEAANQSFKGVLFAEAKNMTMSEYIKEWLFQFKKPEVTARTFEWYNNISSAHIIPELGTIHLSKLTAYDVQALLNKKMSKKLSARSVKAIRDTLNQAFKHAVEMNLIAINPVSGTKLPKHDRTIKTEEVKAIPIEQRKKILAVLEDNPVMKPIVLTLMFSGIRIGELLALTWGNVDLKKETLIIDRAVTIKPEYDEDGNRQSRDTVVATTKTYSSNRKIKVPTQVIGALKEWKVYQKKLDPLLVIDEAVVFANKFGHMRTYNGFRATYRRFLQQNSFDAGALNLHCCRHTFATMLLEAGVNPRVVQKLMGHKDIETTLGTYSHVLAEVYDGVADTLNHIYSNLQAGNYTPKVSVSDQDLLQIYCK